MTKDTPISDYLSDLHKQEHGKTPEKPVELKCTERSGNLFVFRTVEQK